MPRFLVQRHCGHASRYDFRLRRGRPLPRNCFACERKAVHQRHIIKLADVLQSRLAGETNSQIALRYKVTRSTISQLFRKAQRIQKHGSLDLLRSTIPELFD